MASLSGVLIGVVLAVAVTEISERFDGRKKILLVTASSIVALALVVGAAWFCGAVGQA